MEKDIEKMSVTELKAMAYDVLGVLENAQRNLQILNAQIQKLQEEEKSKKK